MRKKRTLKVQQNRGFSEALNEFIRHSRNKGLRDSTISAYQSYLKEFGDWLCVPLSLVEQETVEEYVEELRNRNVRDTTAQTHIRHIRCFLYYCMDKGWVERFKVRLPKADEPYKEPYTEEEIEKLVALPQSANFVEWRSWIFICLLVGTGCRLSTALNLRIEDINFNEGLIHYTHTKNRRNQYVPLSAELAKRLKLWIDKAGLESGDYLIPNSFSDVPTPLNKSTIQHEIVEYNKRRGITKHSIHLFRHTFAKNWICQGGSVAKLQRILGHTSLSTTNRYLLLYSADLRDGFDNFTLL